MLDKIGVSSEEALFACIPSPLRCGPLALAEGLTEMEVQEKMRSFAEKNRIFPAIFRGAGAYKHYIPSIVKSVTTKEEFVTAYTPYQAEISQGLLQSIFEYQSLICELTGMDVSNASVYDGATAAAEAAAMCRDKRKPRFLVSAAVHPMVIETIRTYVWGRNAEIELIPLKDGTTDPEALDSMLDNNVGGVYFQQPNFYGQLEDSQVLTDLIHSVGAKVVMGVNPISLGLLMSPGEVGADIAVGEGQPLGMPLSFGGPYLGFMACKKDLMRRMPGRIVGETTDRTGNRAYVLTLQAREQHIRREKASSNICSNQALCAMTAAVYLTAMGPAGLVDCAQACYANAHTLAEKLDKMGYKRRFPGDFFHEFLTDCPVPLESALFALEQQGILGGLQVEGGILWCCTECNTPSQIEALCDILREVKS